MEQSPVADSNFQILGKTFKLRQPVPLCGRCQVIIDNWKPASGRDSIGFRHLDSRHEINLSAESGCVLCSLFIKSPGITQEWSAEGEPTPLVLLEDRSRSRMPPVHKLMIPYQAEHVPYLSIVGQKQTWTNPCSTYRVIITPATSQGMRIPLHKFPGLD